MQEFTSVSPFNEIFELTGQPKLVLDANNIIDNLKADMLRKLGCQAAGESINTWKGTLEQIIGE